MKKSEKYFFNTALEEKRFPLKFEVEQASEQLFEMGFKKGMRFLDVGCGIGQVLRLVSILDKRNKHLFGVDSNKDILSRAVLQARNNKNLKYCTGNIYRLPFKNDTFDFIWCRLTIEHLVNPLFAIKEMKRLLTRGGIIALGDLDGNCLFHYPLNKHFEKRIQRALKLLEPFGFDPFVGRKLFHLLKISHFKNICTKIFPYHNIYGKPEKKVLISWAMKINSTIDFLKNNSDAGKGFLEKTRKEFIDYIRSNDTFTYSVLIFAKGVK